MDTLRLWLAQQQMALTVAQEDPAVIGMAEMAELAEMAEVAEMTEMAEMTEVAEVAEMAKVAQMLPSGVIWVHWGCWQWGPRIAVTCKINFPQRTQWAAQKSVA